MMMHVMMRWTMEGDGAVRLQPAETRGGAGEGRYSGGGRAKGVRAAAGRSICSFLNGDSAIDRRRPPRRGQSRVGTPSSLTAKGVRLAGLRWGPAVQGQSNTKFYAS